MNLSEENIRRIKKMCVEFKVRSFSAFGSVTRNNFRPDSDIDFLVDFNEDDPFKYTDLYFNFKEKLELLLKRKIDLVEERGVKNNFFRKEVESTKMIIYGQ